MKWLITGGCGFIGRSLVSDLLAEGGHAIRLIDNLSVGTPDDLATVTAFKRFQAAEAWGGDPEAGQVQLIVGDITDDQLAMRACAGMDVIVHLAANTGVAPSVENPRMDCVTNVIGTFNYLEAARANGVKRFIFASSGAPVGECTPPIHEELAPHPVSPYGASKLAGEGYCSAYFRTFGVETVALRFGNVYGPLSGRKNSVVARCIRRALDGEPLEIYGDGTQTRDFLYIDDLVQAIRLSVSAKNVGGEAFQIATASETTVGEVIAMLVEVMKEEGLPEVPVVYEEKRLGDVMRNFSDTSKAGRILGWVPKVNLPEGLRVTLKWFLNKN